MRDLANWMEDREVTWYLNEERGTAEQLRKLAASVPEPMLTYHFNQRGRFFMACGGDESAVGFAKLKEMEDARCYEIVFAIGDKSLWGNGYGSQAVQVAESKAFLDWRVRKLTAKIYRKRRKAPAFRHGDISRP